MSEKYPGKCPKCGWFCSDIKATATDECLKSVAGKCKQHGKVDLSNQGWSWEDFFTEHCPGERDNGK